MNSVNKRAGQEISRMRDALSAARIRPSTAATANPRTVACMVTTRPLSNMGSIELANSQSFAVFHAMPKSMSASPRAAAPDGPFQQFHHGRQHPRHAEAPQQQQGVDRAAVLRNVANLLGAECQVAKTDRRHQGGVLQIL